MEITNTDYTGWKNGKCWRIATKFSGLGADSINSRIVSEMVRDGYEIREMSVPEAVTAHIAAITGGEYPGPTPQKATTAAA